MGCGASSEGGHGSIEDVAQFTAQLNTKAELTPELSKLAKKVRSNPEALVRTVMADRADLLALMLGPSGAGRVVECDAVTGTKSTGWTLLHHACEHGALACLALLLERGADVNLASEKYQVCPIHVACRACNIPCVKTLLEHKARLDVFDLDTLSPLDYAVTGRPARDGSRLQLVKLLIEDQKCGLRPATQVRAAAGGDVAVVDYFLSLPEPPRVDLLLNAAVGAGQAELARHLIHDRGARANFEVAVVATKQPHLLPVLRELLTTNSNLAREQGGEARLSLLHHALTEKNVAAAAYLVTVPGVPELETSSGNDGLRAACVLTRDPEVLSNLAKKSLKQETLNRANKLGQTALHLAVLHNNLPAVEILLSIPETDVLARDSSNKIALEYCEEKTMSQFQNARDKLVGLRRAYEVPNWPATIGALWLQGIPGQLPPGGNIDGEALLQLASKTIEKAEQGVLPANPDLHKKLVHLHDIWGITQLVEPLTRARFESDPVLRQPRETWGVTEVSLWFELVAHMPERLAYVRTYSVLGKNLVTMNDETMALKLGLKTQPEMDALRALINQGS